jgi:hypothetical protein
MPPAGRKGSHVHRVLEDRRGKEEKSVQREEREGNMKEK